MLEVVVNIPEPSIIKHTGGRAENTGLFGEGKFRNVLSCGMDRTRFAQLPTYCQSAMSRWEGCDSTRRRTSSN
jgi:hypothetical protein